MIDKKGIAVKDFDAWLPVDRKYDDATYMWAKRDAGSGNILIGAGRPTLNSLGDLAYLSLAEPGRQVQRGQSAGSMEAAKMTGEIITPVSGEVVARNESVLKNPRILNEDPYEAGWLLAISPQSWSEESAQLCESSILHESLPQELRAPSQGAPAP